MNASKGNTTLVFGAIGAAGLIGCLLALRALTRGEAQTSAPTSPPAEATVAALATAPATATALATASAEAPRAAPTASAAPATDKDALADVTLEFGESGDHDGQLRDARAIAVDATGDIYVADYGSGRIQRFDPSGKFVSGFRVAGGKAGTFVPTIAATSDGYLWVACGGNLLKVALPDGKVVKTVPSQEPRVAYTVVAVDPTNTVYAENEGATTWTSTNGQGPPRSDDLRKLDKNGSVLAAWKGVRKGDTTSRDRLAVDREGNVYLAAWGRDVEVIDPHGKVKAQLDVKGVGGVAVDANGRVLVGTGRGIAVLDATGSKLGDIASGDVESFALGQDGRVYVLSRSRVLVLKLR